MLRQSKQLYLLVKSSILCYNYKAVFIAANGYSTCQLLFVWDNEDHIIEIVADLDKESTMFLLNITKIKKIFKSDLPKSTSQKMYIIEGEKPQITQRGGIANALQKMVASLAAAVILCLNFSAVSYAEMVNPFEDYGISLTYEIANSCTADLEIQNGTAHCTSIAKGTDAVSITVTQTLQKHWGLWIWSNVKGASWSQQVNGGSICLTSSKSGLDSGTYRVKSVFTLTDKNGKSEKIKIYSDTKTVS